MALNPAGAAPIPIFTELSEQTDSPVFFVTPGTVVQAQAFGFACQASRADKSVRAVPQVACLEMILFKEVIISDELDCTCTKLYDLNKITSEVLAIENVMLNGCCLCLSAQNNMMLLNVPGAYRFVMNDASALGTARVFLRSYRASDIPWGSPFMMGADL